jgi:cobaltochelatase CobN
VPTPHPGRLAQADKTPAPDARAAILFYRSHALSADTAPIAALADALAARGMQVRAFFLDSLKNPQTAAAIAATLRAWRPSVVLNATGFAAPLDAAGAPVLQLVLAGSTRDAWAAATRGLSPADLAMQVVLPEFDGRLATTAISFKEEAAPDPTLEYAARRHRPDPDGIALAADRAAGWARLSGTRRAARRIGVMLSDYPGGQAGHAVGLDSFASLAAILALLADEGFATTPAAPAELAAALTRTPPRPLLSLDRYRSLFTTLPQPVQDAVTAAWGDPADDPAIADGCFTLRQLHLGRIWIALQPDRGSRLDRRAGYHDPDTPPRHGFVAAHLWLRHVYAAHALVQLGAHGTLEWLPGKPVAPAAACLPSALAGGLPVIYPFIANNPGEAAPAKRRLGAVTIGHLTPPLRPAGSHGAALELERLIDDHAGADGLDRRRTAILRREILDRAAATGLLAESGVAPDAPEDAALARLDAYLCDVKDMLIGDGLHVFATAPEPARRALLLAALQRSCPGFDPATLDACAGAERAGLLAALDGRFVPAGPAGAPTRGRADVLPTGRNLSAIDPRAVPTRAALTLAERAADELLRRHLQDHGDWPRHLVLELWGSATMRTGGEAFALALVLLGARPVWDAGSARVSGVEILPLAVLDRPRVDVTLRISGLFRDAFEAQLALFDTAIGAIAARDEAAEWNPLAAACRGLDADARRRATARIYGPAGYGAGIAERLARGAWGTAAELGQAYLDASAQAFGRDGEDAAGLAARIRDAAAFVHVQDHREADLLDGTEHAAHQGGFAAAATALGAAPALYHADMSDPDAPRARTLQEEIARVVRGRAANPGWIAGMTRHGASGAAEIARAVEGLAGFAATVPFRLDRQFDLLFAATLAAPEVDDFLRAASPAAHQAIAARFAEALRRDLWRPHRNDAAARLGVAA